MSSDFVLCYARFFPALTLDHMHSKKNSLRSTLFSPISVGINYKFPAPPPIKITSHPPLHFFMDSLYAFCWMSVEIRIFCELRYLKLNILFLIKMKITLIVQCLLAFTKLCRGESYFAIPIPYVHKY